MYQCDHLGTPQRLISPQGKVEWQAELDPWGNLLSEQNPDNLYQLIRMQGQHYDEESGLHYNPYRYYDPKQGRYITQDPIGLEGGLNLYQYTTNPIKQIDPLGLMGYDACVNTAIGAGTLTGGGIGTVGGSWIGSVGCGAAGRWAGGRLGAALGGAIGGVIGRLTCSSEADEAAAAEEAEVIRCRKVMERVAKLV